MPGPGLAWLSLGLAGRPCAWARVGSGRLGSDSAGLGSSGSGQAWLDGPARPGPDLAAGLALLSGP